MSEPTEPTTLQVFMAAAYGELKEKVDEYLRDNPLPPGTELMYCYEVNEITAGPRRSARLASKR